MDIPLSFFESLESTSSYAQKLLSEGKKAPFAIQSRKQTKGLGQRGKSWTSPKGNLYISIVLPNAHKELKERSLIPLKAACLVSKWLVKELDLHPRIKWPNDLYFAGKKLGGILCQSSVKSFTWGDLVIGIGLNVNEAPDISDVGYQSISLAQIANKFIDVKKLAESLTSYWSKEWFETTEHQVREHYRNFSSMPFNLWQDGEGRNAKVYWESGISPDGSLLLMERAINAQQAQRRLKLSSANHGMSNVFLGKSTQPFLVACKWQGFFFLAMYAHRYKLRPDSLYRLGWDQVSSDLKSALRALRESIDQFSMGLVGNILPVLSDGISLQDDKEVVDTFSSFGFELCEAPLTPRLSNLAGLDLPNSRVRLAVNESRLELNRLSNGPEGGEIMVDGPSREGVDDHDELVHCLLHGLMLLALG
ncbi:MAG: biotin--[acetyl-CoA-carboxylase] ligase [Oligoflexales bacterium]|nr:biotin--[acetyl-CoA-carboxylase] ligase [Oligoflexales bacterium]